MSFTMCTSGQAIMRAGSNANSSIIIDVPTLNAWSTEAEGLIDAETGMSITANFGGYALSGAASIAAASKIAMAIIAYDTTGYISREADTLMNNNDGAYKAAIKNMKEKQKNNLTSPN